MSNLLFPEDGLYTEQQAMVLTILPCLTGPLSVVGSGVIIYIVIKDRKRKLKKVYHRLLLGYSIVDVMTSFNLSLSALVVPKGTVGVWGAQGNVATCEASGFINQFFQSQGLYNAFMCVYMLLVVRFDVREEFIAKWVEPFVHGIAFLCPIIIAGIALSQRLYNPAIVIVGWCFINGAPGDCIRYPDEFECERGANYAFWQAVLNMPYFLYLALVVVSCVGTYLRVRHFDRRMSGWSFGSNVLRRQGGSLRRLQRSQTSLKTKDTFRQAMLYIVSFLCTYGFYGLNTVFGPADYTSTARHFYFPLTVLVKIFLPLQGAWNCFIFMYPRYTALKRRNPDAAFSNIVKQIFLHSHDMPKRIRLGDRPKPVQNPDGSINQPLGNPTTQLHSSSGLVDEPGTDDFQPKMESSSEGTGADEEEDNPEPDFSTRGQPDAEFIRFDIDASGEIVDGGVLQHISSYDVEAFNERKGSSQGENVLLHSNCPTDDRFATTSNASSDDDAAIMAFVRQTSKRADLSRNASNQHAEECQGHVISMNKLDCARKLSLTRHAETGIVAQLGDSMAKEHSDESEIVSDIRPTSQRSVNRMTIATSQRVSAKDSKPPRTRRRSLEVLRSFFIRGGPAPSGIEKDIAVSGDNHSGEALVEQEFRQRARRSLVFLENVVLGEEEEEGSG